MSVLQFISSLKWPIVVLVLLAVTVRGVKRNPGFGRWLRSWVDRRDFSGKAGPVEFQTSTAAAVEQAAAATAASDAELTAVAAATEQQEALDPELATYDAADLRREVVEELMRTSARWGWEMAQMGFRTPPNPHITWSAEGRPSIMFGSGTALEQILAAQVPTRLTPAEINRRAGDGPQPDIGNEGRQAAIRRKLDEIRRDQSGL